MVNWHTFSNHLGTQTRRSRYIIQPILQLSHFCPRSRSWFTADLISSLRACCKPNTVWHLGHRRWGEKKLMFFGERRLIYVIYIYHIILLMEEIPHQLLGSLSHYLQGFIHSRWCRMSSINSINYICNMHIPRNQMMFVVLIGKGLVWGELTSKNKGYWASRCVI